MRQHTETAMRVGGKELAMQIKLVGQSDVMSNVLSEVSGVIAVLNAQRQVISLNAAFLSMLGLDDAQSQLGLRLGEVLHCVHACEPPDGCGTTKYCSTCGAATSIVSALGMEQPAERVCALTAERNGRVLDIALRVRAHPMLIEGKKFVLLFIQDITKEQQRAILERTFFHDVNNMLGMLIGAGEMLANDYPSDMADIVFRSSLRLQKEVEMQRCLCLHDCEYRPVLQPVQIDALLSELRGFFANHPAARGKTLQLKADGVPGSVCTDASLAMRVLCNMGINAFEGTPSGGQVKLWVAQDSAHCTFCMWNAQPIPEEVAHRVFQRNFSTKGQVGRGIGTYSMKLFGEQLLGGNVSFVTSQQGTEFRFALPCG